MKAAIFSKLAVPSDNFYEGTGCWNSTFEASYFDINAMLNLAVKNINGWLENGRPLHSFVIKSEEQNNNISLKVIDF
jgi:hypothetical protein